MAARDADIKLLIGVATGAPDGDSEQLIRTQLNEIMSKIKVDVTLKTTNFRSQIRKGMSDATKNGKFSVSVSEIKIGANAIKDFKKQLGAVINTLTLDKGVSITIDSKQIGKATGEVKELKQQTEEAARKAAELKVQLRDLGRNNTKIGSGLNSISGGASEAELVTIIALRERYHALEVALETLKISGVEGSTERIEALEAESASILENIELIKQQQRARAEDAAEAEKQARVAQKAASQASQMASYKSVKDLYTKLTSYLNKNPRINDKFRMQLEALQSELYGIVQNSEYAKRGITGLGKQRLTEIISQFSSLDLAITEAGQKGNTFVGILASAYKKFGGWMLVTKSLMLAITQMRKMVTAVVDIDAAMTELKKVTDEADSTYIKFLDNATIRAKKLGATVADTVNASADFARLGYTLDESAQLADAALVYKNVGDGIEDISQASESIISTMKAFGVAAEDSMSIVDKFNEVGNNFAISSEGVGEALRRSASALAAGNNTLDESIALVTAANSVVQDADVVGTTMKTLSMYLRAAKTEAEEAGESTDGMANSVSELRSEILALTNNRVDIQIDDSTFKSTYQIMKELAAVWDDLTDISRANILEQIAGKRNANVVSSLLENFNIAEEAMKSAADSAGSALAENEKYLDSINGKVAAFKATFEELANNLIGSDAIKFVVDLGTGLLNVLNATVKLVNELGGLKTVLIGVGAVVATIKIDSIISTVSKLPAVLLKLGIYAKNIVRVGVVSNAKVLIQTIRSLNSQTALAVPGTSKLSVALKALGISASSAQIAFGALSAAIGIALIAYQRHQQELEEQRAAAKEGAAAYQETSDSLDEYKERITALRTALKESNLSEAEAYEKRKELLSIQDELVSKYGKEAEGIDLVTGSINNQIEALDNLKAAKFDAWYKENTKAVNDVKELFTDFDFTKTNFWGASGNGFTINVPSTADLWGGIKKYDLDITPKDFYDALEEKLRAANIGIEIPVSGITGDFASDLDIENIYDAQRIYSQLWDILHDTGNEFFGSGSTVMDNALGRLSQTISEIGTTINDNEATFNTYAEGVLDTDKEYAAIWGNILAAQKKYNDAVLNGDDKAAAAGLAQMKEAEKEFLAAGWDNNAVNLYVKNFFDKWHNSTKNYEFEIEIKTRLADDKDALGKQIKNALKAFEGEDGTVDVHSILNMDIDQSKATEDQVKGYDRLKTAAESYGMTVEDLCSVLVNLEYVQGAVDDSAARSAASTVNLTQTISELNSAYSLLATAKKEMATGDGLSIETVTALAEANADYLDYIYEENGVIKLNTEAWEKNIDAKAQAEMVAIEDEISALQKENEELAERNRLLASQPQTDSTTAEIDENSRAIEENTEKISANQNKLSVYNTLYNGITSNLDAYTEALSGFTYVKDTIDSVSDSFTTLANLQDTVANGFTLSLDKALEFAAVYPEILDNAYATADGQIALNEDVVNSFIDGKRAELEAQIDEKIAALEADKEALEAEKSYAEAKLELAKAVAEGEANVDAESFAYRVSVGDEATKMLINAGVERATAYKLMAAAMAGNEEEFNRIVAECCSDMDANTRKAAYSMAQNLYKNMNSAKADIVSATKQAHELGKAIAAAANGQVAGSTNQISGSGGGTLGAGINITLKNGSFDGTDYTYTSKTLTLDKFISDLELDISSYDKAISQIDGQIAALEALKNTPFKNFASVRNAGIAKSSSSDSTKDDVKETVKSVEEYIAAIDEYYNALKKLQEIQDKRKSLEKQIEHSDDVAEKINLSSKLINIYHEEIDAEKALAAAKKNTIDANVGALRALGFEISYNSDTNELYIRNLEHLNEITASSAGEYDTLQEATNALRKETEELIDVTEALNDDNREAASTIEDLGYKIQDTKNDIVDYIEEVYKKQTEAYQKIIDKRKEMIESAKDEYDYEADIADKVKEIADLQTRIDQLALDNSRSAQAERLGLIQQLEEKQKELADKQRDHSVDEQTDALDKMASDYEADKDAELEVIRSTVNASEELWTAFYQTLLGQSVSIGDSIDAEIAGAWMRAAEAVREYSASVRGIDGVGTVVSNVPKYHDGGVVSESNIGKDETLAILQKGEVVLNDAKQESLYRIVDFQAELSKRLGVAIGTMQAPEAPSLPISTMMQNATQDIVSGGAQSFVFEPHIEVNITHNGSIADSDAKDYGEKIAGVAIDKLYSAFERRGISSTRGSRLKP